MQKPQTMAIEATTRLFQATEGKIQIVAYIPNEWTLKEKSVIDFQQNCTCDTKHVK